MRVGEHRSEYPDNDQYPRKEIDEAVVEIRGDMKLSRQAKCIFIDHFNTVLPKDKLLKLDDAPTTVIEAIQLEGKLPTSKPKGRGR